MKKLLLAFVALSFLHTVSSQTLFSSAFSADGTANGQIVIVGNELYSAMLTSSNVSKIDLNSPNTSQRVANNVSDVTFIAPWSLVHDNATNILYAGGFDVIYSIGLNATLPVQNPPNIANPRGIVRGMSIQGNLLYYSESTEESISTIDKTVGAASAQEIHAAPDGCVGDFVIYNGFIYYAGGVNGSGASCLADIYRIDLSNLSAPREMIASGPGDAIQELHLVNNYLYAAVEGGTNPILRLDLNNPLTGFSMVVELPNASLGLANVGSTFYAGQNPVNILTFQDPVLNTESFQLDEFSIGPNPAQEFLHVQSATVSTNLEALQLEIIDATGRLIVQPVMRNTVINVSQLAQGMYFLKMLDPGSGKQQTLTFFKE